MRLAENTFICFYLQYLKIKVWGQRGSVKSVDLANLPESLGYAENAVEALKLVIQHDFVLGYVYLNSELKDQARIAIENVLRKSQEDLIFLIDFVTKWNHVILE